MNEVTDCRCCMCPNINVPVRKVCPPGGPQKKPETLCRFVTAFFDDNGAKVFVSNGLGRYWFSVRENNRTGGTPGKNKKFTPQKNIR